MDRLLASTAALLSDPARAAMLTSLLGGIALPAGQLANIARISPQTASSHLSKLVNGRLLAVEQQGRHRYYRLAGAQVANAIEALLSITPQVKDKVGQACEPLPAIDYARSCYSHLAGRMAVEIADALRRRQIIRPGESRQYHVTKAGRIWFEELGIAITPSQSSHPRFARQCLDWSERRHHIAGELGASMFRRFQELKWIAPLRDTRAVRVTLEGQRRLSELLAIPCPPG